MKSVNWQEGGRRLRTVLFVLASLLYLTLAIGVVWAVISSPLFASPLLASYALIGLLGVGAGWECVHQAFLKARGIHVLGWLCAAIGLPFLGAGIGTGLAYLATPVCPALPTGGSYAPFCAKESLSQMMAMALGFALFSLIVAIAVYALWWIGTGFVRRNADVPPVVEPPSRLPPTT